MAQIIIFNDKSLDVTAFRRTHGAYRIASALKSKGYSVQVIDWFSSWTMDGLKYAMSLCIGPETLWVGWSSTFMVALDYKLEKKDPANTALMFPRPPHEMDEIFKWIRANSNARTVYGGAYAHLHNQEPRIDHYIWGYADRSVVEFTNALAQGQIPDRIIDSRPLEADVNDIYTDWTDPSFCLMPGEAIPIEMARGCIFKCRFCNYALIGKRKGTYERPLDQIRQQMIDVYNLTGNTRYYFTDDTFNDSTEKLEILYEMFQTLPFKPQFSCFLRLDLIERWPHTAQLLLDMGLTGCFFGVESFNKKSGIAIGKGLDPKRTKAELQRLKDLWGNRVNFTVGLILGLPYDTEEYFQELEDWLLEPGCPVENVSLNALWIGPKPKEGATQQDGYSEFNLNLDVYGYERISGGHWRLPSQGLTQDICSQWRKRILSKVEQRFKICEFYVQDYQNIGVSLEDIQTITVPRINFKYNMHVRAQTRIAEYIDRVVKYLETTPTK